MPDKGDSQDTLGSTWRVDDARGGDLVVLGVDLANLVSSVSSGHGSDALRSLPVFRGLTWPPAQSPPPEMEVLVVVVALASWEK